MENSVREFVNLHKAAIDYGSDSIYFPDNPESTVFSQSYISNVQKNSKSKRLVFAGLGGTYRPALSLAPCLIRRSRPTANSFRESQPSAKKFRNSQTPPFPANSPTTARPRFRTVSILISPDESSSPRLAPLRVRRRKPVTSLATAVFPTCFDTSISQLPPPQSSGLRSSKHRAASR